MFNRKNLSLLFLLLFLLALCKGLFQSPMFQEIFSSQPEKSVIQEEIYLTQEYSQPEIYVEAIIDVSGSMWGQIQGVNKIINSRGVMNVLLKDLPDNVRLGLRTFGGSGESRLEVPLGVNNREQIQEIIQQLRPSGKSPIGYAIEQAGKDLQTVQGRKYILLISDGIDNGQIDPVAKVRELKAEGIITHVIHVHSSGGTGETRLQEIAETGGGHFFNFNERDLVVPTMTLP